ncbi:MAG: hypothetical protein ACXWUG_23470 [Polyangiales bacterium]
MGFKPGDNVTIEDEDRSNVLGRVRAHVGDGWFEVEVDGESEPRKVSARQLRHLDSVKMRIARPSS